MFKENLTKECQYFLATEIGISSNNTAFAWSHGPANCQLTTGPKHTILKVDKGNEMQI